MTSKHPSQFAAEVMGMPEEQRRQAVLMLLEMLTTDQIKEAISKAKSLRG